jgi:hypothetical protein
MSDLFVRIKGRVQGPFDLETLQGMVKRGQLSRIHQVSEDGEVWKKATDYAELFKTQGRNSYGVQVEQSPREGQSVQKQDPVTEPAAPHVSPSEWHIEENGQPKGPYTFIELQKMLRTGAIQPSNYVWRDGMADWVPAEAVNGLVDSVGTFSQAAKLAGAQSKGHGSLDAQTVSSLSASRGWVIMCAVALVIWGLFQLVVAFISLVEGVRENLDERIIASIIEFGFAFVFAIGAWVTFAYSSGILKVRIDRDISSLNEALRRLNRIWVFVGVFLTLMALIFIVFFILAVATQQDYSRYWQ